MKNFKKVIISVVAFLIMGMNVKAGVSVYASKSTITNGSSVTFYIKVTNAASWNVKGTSSGATSGCKINEADSTSNAKNTTKTFSATCKATSIGTIGFSASGDYTDENGKNMAVSGTTSVNVVKPRDPDTNNYLSSLSVEGYDINPAFNKETLEYVVTVPSTVNEVTINASKASKYAKLTGTGTFAVEEGRNEFDVKVVSETEITRLYKVIVNVEDINPIEVKVNGKTYTVVKNAKNLTMPEYYTETTVNIADNIIPAFYNEKTNYTLVGLKDEEGNIGLFIYDNDKYSYYNEIKSELLTIVILDYPEVLKGYKEKEITINDSKVKALVVKDNSNFAIVYGVNVLTGEKAYYEYNLKDKTISKYNDELIIKLQNKNQKLSYIMLATCVSTAIFFVLTFVLLVFNKKKKKLIKKYIDKNELKVEKQEAKKNKKETESETKIVDEKEEVSSETEEYNLFDDEKKKKKKSKK